MELVIVALAAGTVALFVIWLQRFFTQKEEVLRKRVEAIAQQDALATASPALRSPRSLGLVDVFSKAFGPRLLQKQADMLASADLAFRPAEFITIRLMCGAVAGFAGLVLFDRALSGAVLAILAYQAPILWVNWRKAKRRSNFDLQLPDTLQLVTNSLRSGFSFPKAIEVAAQSSAPPMSKELGVVLRETNLGMAIDTALHNMSRRVESPDFDIVVSAYLIQREVGGNLAVVMEKVADTVRQRIRLRGEISVLTAQGKFSGFVVGLLPVAVFVVLLVCSPGYFDPLLKNTRGQLFLGLAVFLQLIGVLTIKKVITVKM